MALYELKPGTPIEASQYAPGLQDGTTTFTSDTVGLYPIPLLLEEIAGYYVVGSPAGEWTCTIPYIGAVVYLFPDDYIITPDIGDKYRMSKVEFEAMYQLSGSL